MKIKFLIMALMAFSIFGCGKDKEDIKNIPQNTDEYFKAHGLVKGGANDLRIGDAFFRFPAGVGLNPYTSRGGGSSGAGSDGVSENEKYKIVKGRADKVTIYLNAEDGYRPSPSPFPVKGAIRVEISRWGSPPSQVFFKKVIQDKSIVVEHGDLGLREFRSEKSWIGSIYESTLPQLQFAPDGGKLFFGCQPSANPMSGLCGASYWKAAGRYSVSIAMDKSYFLEHWQTAYPAVVSFVESVASK